MLKEQENLRGPLLWPDRNPLVMVLEPFSKHSSSQTLDPKSHNFVTCSFSSSQLCHVCWHPYRGVIHQGLQCDGEGDGVFWCLGGVCYYHLFAFLSWVGCFYIYSYCFFLCFHCFMYFVRAENV